MKKLLDRTFWMYVGLGFLNYFFCSTVMLIFKNVLQLSETACLIIAFALQTIISFVLNRYVTFRGIPISSKWPILFVCTVAVCYLVAKVLLRDVFAYLITLPVPSGFVNWLHGIFGKSLTTEAFGENLVMLACTFTYCVINYIGQRYFVFKPRKPEK